MSSLISPEEHSPISLYLCSISRMFLFVIIIIIMQAKPQLMCTANCLSICQRKNRATNQRPSREAEAVKYVYILH